MIHGNHLKNKNNCLKIRFDKNIQEMCHPFFCQNVDVRYLPCLWHICKVSYNILLIAIYLCSSFYQIRYHAATICNWCWYLSSVTTISISFFSSHRSKNIIFLWAWGQQRISCRRSRVRERKKKVALFYACVHIIMFRPTLCR